MPKTERGPYKTGIERKKEIIRAARDCLIEEGYAAFSLRKVAKRVAISVGNLQHHFPTKQALVAEMLDVVTAEYIAEIDQISAGGDTPEKEFFLIIQTITRDLNTFETTRFFPELWSLANHDAEVQRLTDRMYDSYRKAYEKPMKAINPALTDEQLDKISLFIAACLEGHTLFIGSDKKYTPWTDDLIQMAYSSFLLLVKQGDVPV